MSLEPKILIIDDDPIVLEAVVDVLETVGYAVASTYDGPAGVEALKENTASIVMAIVDQNMVGWTGIKTIAHLRGISPNLYCILATGALLPADEYQLETRPDAVLPKPFDFDTLVNAVEKGLEHTK